MTSPSAHEVAMQTYNEWLSEECEPGGFSIGPQEKYPRLSIDQVDHLIKRIESALTSCEKQTRERDAEMCKIHLGNCAGDYHPTECIEEIADAILKGK